MFRGGCSQDEPELIRLIIQRSEDNSRGCHSWGIYFKVESGVTAKPTRTKLFGVSSVGEVSVCVT